MVFNRLYPEYPLDEEPVEDEVEELAEAVEEQGGEVEDTATIAVTPLLTSPVDFQGEAYYIVVTTNGPLRGFLYPATEIIGKNVTLEIDPRQLIEIYQWTDELAAMIPDIQTVLRNLLLSFWRAGAIDRASIRQPAVRSALFRSAFPYKLNIDEE